MMTVAWRIFLKELKDHWRDRRSLLTVAIGSILMGPLSLLLFSHFITGLEEKSTRREITVSGAQHGPDLANFFARQAYTVKAAPADYETRLKNGSLTVAVLVVPPDFQQKLARAETADVQLVYDDSRTDAMPSVRAATRLVQAFNSEQASLRLLARGVTPTLVAPVRLDDVNLAPSQARGAQMLFLVPMFGLLACLMGALSVAIDVTAGERERGSLEPLLLNPLDTRAVVLGKWGVVTVYSAGVVCLTLLGFVLAMKLVRSESLAALFQFGPRELAVFAGLLLPFAGLASALLMLVAAYGRSYKEAQTYAGYIMMVVNFVPLVTFFLSAQDAPWQRFVPALAQHMAMARATRGGGIGALDIVLPGAVSLLGALACLWLLARLLRDERVVFGRS
jgi:sodium transport system permease protein